MPVPDELLAKLNAHLAAKGGIKPCAVCGRPSTWNATTIIAPLEHAPRYPLGSGFLAYPSMAPPMQPVPLIMVTCSNCFNSIFFPLKLVEGT